MQKLPILLLLMFGVACLHAQNNKRTNIWYFGYNAGLDFNTNPPTPLLDNTMYTREGCATYCDTFGQLLLYTDGISIWNKQHEIMPGATDLGGDKSSSQSGIIVPKPGSGDTLYVFSVDQRWYPGGLRYAIVDMNLNGGLGGLINQNNVLLNTAAEKITAIPHCNGRDFWILGHDQYNSFFAWLLSDLGLNSTPVQSTTGSNHGIWEELNAIGYMRANNSGNRLALANLGSDYVELFEFNGQTGIVSNPLLLQSYPLTENAYGVEFSPNGRFLYVAGNKQAPLVQFDLSLPTAQDIINQAVLISSDNGSPFGGLQMAPDGNLYVTRDTVGYLSIIYNPNEQGLACNYVEDAIYLGGPLSGIGLPNQIPSYLYQAPSLSFSTEIDTCGGTASIYAEIAASSNFVQYQWFLNGNLLQGQTTALLDVTASGNYRLVATVEWECRPTDSLALDITIDLPDQLTIDSVVVSPADCNLNNGVITVLTYGGTSPLMYAGGITNPWQSENVFTEQAPGTYQIVVSDANGCMDSVFANITANQTLPEITEVQLVPGSCYDPESTITVFVTNISGPVTYSIDGQNFQPDSIFNILSNGLVTVYVMNIEGCFDTMEVNIPIVEPPLLEAINIVSTSCGKNNGTISVIASGSNLSYLLNGGIPQNQNVFTNLPPGNYTIEVTDINGCSATDTVTIAASEPIFIEQIIQSGTSCGKINGSISINVSGGVGGLLFSIDGQAFVATPFFDSLSAGLYTVTVTDSAGCLLMDEVEVPASSAVEIDQLVATASACTLANGTISVSAVGGMPDHLFSINNGLPQYGNTFENLEPGFYSLAVIDAYGCTDTSSVVVPRGKCPVYIPNVFSPNEDGINDVFQIFSVENSGSTVLTYDIYGRWGEHIYHAEAFPLTYNQYWWDGTFRGKPVMPGVYVFVVRVQHTNGETDLLEGDVTVIRY